MNAVLRCALACSLLLIPPIAAAELESWVATWAASPEPADDDPNQPILNLQDQTVRERVRISVGGSRVRICLTNEYGSSPILVGSVRRRKSISFTTDISGDGSCSSIRREMCWA
jgi:hypothetical protein